MSGGAAARGLVVAVVVASAAAGCDRELARLEQERTSAELRLAELERAGRALRARSVDDLERWRRALDRRLPDLPRGALTASVALAVSGVPEVKVDGPLAAETRGQVLTEPVVVRLPGGLDALDALLQRLAPLDRPWQLDAVTREGPVLRVALHGFVFASGSVGEDTRPVLEPSAEEGTWLARDRDHVRRVTRALRERVDDTRAQLEQSGLEGQALDAFRTAELKESLLVELDKAARRQTEDVRLVFGALRDARVLPLVVTFSVRAGRRLCSIRVETLEAKNDLILVGTSRYGLAGDAKRTELTLPSGRVCALAVGPPPR